MSYRLRPLYRLYLSKLPSWQQALFLFVGVAFLLQSYVAQTHIHPLAQAPANALASLDSGISVKGAKPDQQVPSRDRLPANDDPAKCPLCQAVAHAGQYVWPHAAVFILPQLAAAIVPVAVAILRIPERQSHDWQGRAPPRL
ncbi:MAG TPA: DUF2946 family protein [Rhizomicrobium sp.]|jgi:hypothetical protein|nr:DUF2946 family protein [Rhizomicrobium sp.]